MTASRRFTLRFRLRTLFVLILGIALGYALNLRTLQILIGVPSESNMASLPTYVIAPPDVLAVQITNHAAEPIANASGEYLVSPDGNVNLGKLGHVQVAGRTLDEARDAIEVAAAQLIAAPQVLVDVVAFNSKVYYVVERNAARGDNVMRAPITGNETVLDAVAAVGAEISTNTELWIARPAPDGVGGEQVLPVRWDKAAAGSVVDNYQIFPGDRVFIATKSPSTAQN